MFTRPRPLVLFLALCLMTGSSLADVPDLSLQDCAAIPDGQQRLRCYDLVVARSHPGLLPQPAPALPAEATAHINVPLADPATVVDPSAAPAQKPPAIDLPTTQNLAELWELGPATKRGVFVFRPHRPNYFLLTYNRDPNNAPYRPIWDLAGKEVRLAHEELAFQLSFKTKLVEDLLASPLDLWFGYTQQSFWQAGNRRASSPFRETNYQPELMAALPLNFRFLGLDARLLNLGLVHQSNGQAGSLSRSWNRIYAQVGLERNNFRLLGRVWHRLSESQAQDDNPDILDYMGHGDLLATWQVNAHELSALGRYHFDTGHGALQLGWAFPLTSNLKGYVQLFSGYGQSLIDYNHAQQSLGVGIMLNY